MPRTPSQVEINAVWTTPARAPEWVTRHTFTTSPTSSEAQSTTSTSTRSPSNAAFDRAIEQLQRYNTQELLRTMNPHFVDIHCRTGELSEEDNNTGLTVPELNLKEQLSLSYIENREIKDLLQQNLARLKSLIIDRVKNVLITYPFIPSIMFVPNYRNTINSHRLVHNETRAVVNQFHTEAVRLTSIHLYIPINNISGSIDPIIKKKYVGLSSAVEFFRNKFPNEEENNSSFMLFKRALYSLNDVVNYDPFLSQRAFSQELNRTCMELNVYMGDLYTNTHNTETFLRRNERRRKKEHSPNYRYISNVDIDHKRESGKFYV